MSGTESVRRALRVLVVDDHQDGADSCALLLLYGHEVRVSRSSAEAVKAADSFGPDVLLLDIGLPDGDGYALAERLLATLPSRPVLVAVTGFNHFEERSQEAGFDHHLVKPVEPGRLARLLEECARRMPRGPVG